MGNSQSDESYTSIKEDDFWIKVPLFALLPTEARSKLRECGKDVHFDAGQTIIEQDAKGDAFFILRGGQAKVEVDGQYRAKLIRGDYFGENALLQEVPRTASIIAVTQVNAISIHRSDFQKLGLHTQLQFKRKKRDTKINTRHQMMAGVAGIKVEKNEVSNAVLGGIDPNGLMKMTRFDAEEEQPTWFGTQKTILIAIFTDRINVTAFLFVPLGQFCKYMEYSPGIIFVSNFFAIIPLASILGQATEALSEHTGQLIGGLLNATFGNAVEMIMCIQAVKKGLIKVVQGNLLGSILSNLLLVLGMAIFASGTARKTQKFNQQGAASNMTCQLVASISVCLPTCFATVTNYHEGSVLTISRICSVFLLFVYGSFLFFMLRTHAVFFGDEENDNEEKEAGLDPRLSLLFLFFTTLAVFLASECLVDTIEGVSEDYGLSKAFIGVILLPIVGNAAEHATAVTSAYKGMMDLALGVAVGSSTQIALFVVPCAVIAGYFFNQPMNLNFTVFDTTCQMLTVFLVSQVLQHGSTNWLHGAMLMTVYTFIAVMTLYMRNPVDGVNLSL